MCAYEREISRQNKACFLFLLDQSTSMEDALGGKSGTRKCDELATALNAWLQNMVIVAAKESEIRDYLDIGVLGYRTDDANNSIIEPALKGDLAGRKLVSIVDIEKSPLRMEERIQYLPDDDTGELIEMPIEMPIWIEPVASGGTPTCQALYDATLLLDEWIASHPNSFPPVVIHITDGESSDGTPIPYADALKERATSDGNVLLFNCCLSDKAADPFILPSSAEVLPSDFARELFEMSSPLPESLYQRAVSDNQFDLKPGARGMAFNADMIALIKFLDIGTKVATPKLR